MKGHCPECEKAGRDSLHEIVPTGESMNPNNEHEQRRYNVLVLHPDGQGNLCPGGGQRI